MSWSHRLLEVDASGGQVERPPGATGGLAGAVAGLIAQQKASWPQLARGYAALDAVQTRPIQVGRSGVVLQHNPGRIRNTTADVAAAAAGERPCFLCPGSLPPEERGIPFGADLVILCNPVPILDRHLSIVHRDHVPQRLDGSVGALLELAESLGPRFFVLYNGPRCGASAPDHLHFQACARDLLPVERDLAGRAPGSAAGDGEGCVVLPAQDYGRSVIVLRARDRGTLGHWIQEVVGALPGNGGEEPLVNIVCAAGLDQLTAFVFPRARHRPSAYFAGGDERLLVSPGAIDMAGVVVLPERRDFERLDARRLAAVFDEVTLPGELVNQAMERACPALLR